MKTTNIIWYIAFMRRFVIGAQFEARKELLHVTQLCENKF